MRAVWLREFGAPDVLVAGDAPDPAAGPGQALIEVAFANVTFVETQFRASGAGPFEPELPMIPGNGVGGVVSAVGAGGAAEPVIGQRFPLERAADAHAAIEARATVGKTLLEVSADRAAAARDDVHVDARRA